MEKTELLQAPLPSKWAQMSDLTSTSSRMGELWEDSTPGISGGRCRARCESEQAQREGVSVGADGVAWGASRRSTRARAATRPVRTVRWPVQSCVWSMGEGKP